MEMKLTSQTARSNGFLHLLAAEIARVHLFVDNYSRVVAQFPVELSGAGVDRIDARGAALQQAIGESAGGGANVQADFSSHGNSEMIERGFQLQPAAADITRLLEQLDFRASVDVRARLVGLLAIDQHLPGQNQRAGFLARLG